MASISQGPSPAVVSHYNVQPVIDIYGTTHGRDLGAVAADIRQILHDTASQVPPGSTVVLRGQVTTMTSAYAQLIEGLGMAIVLIYLLIVVNFQSWLDPFVIVTALPAALAGIVWMLFVTETTLSVPALTGAIMCMGVATANSILVISFAREVLSQRGGRAGRRQGSRRHPLSPRADDGAGDDHRHGADGAQCRTERAARAGGDRRPAVRHLRYAVLRSCRLLDRTRQGQPDIGNHITQRTRPIRMLEKVENQMPRDTAAEHDRPAAAQAAPDARPRADRSSSLAAVGLGVTGIMSRNHDEAKLTKWTQAQAIPTVNVVTPERGTKNQELILPGDVEAYYEAPIYARVPGYLKMWYKDIGAHVKAGQELAVIDTPDLDQQLEQAKSDLASVQANAKLADLTAKRWKALLSSQSVSQQTVDEKVGDAAAKNALVAAAQANVDRLQALESFKHITAPFDGVVTARETDIGALINAGSGSGSGAELFKVADIHQMRVYVRVPQAYASQLRPGMVADLKLAQYPHEVFKAKLDTTSNAISKQSRTVLVELMADNMDGKLWPGTFAEVHFQLPPDPDIYHIPTSALVFREHGLQVATVGDDDKVRLKSITAWPRSGHRNRGPVRPHPVRPGDRQPARLNQHRRCREGRGRAPNECENRGVGRRKARYRRMTPARLLCVAGCMVTLAGCDLAPPYHPPTVAVPSAFKEAVVASP